jgi:DNA-3-methyladenine glycosylase II
VTVRGVGRWTAEMFLLFQMHRPDVWPVDDLGVRNGWARIHAIESPPLPKALLVLGEPLSPYRSAAAWYCWRAAASIPAVTRARPPVKAAGRRSPSRPKKA